MMANIYKIRAKLDLSPTKFPKPSKNWWQWWFPFTEVAVKQCTVSLNYF
jgi:hypothetical protein